MSEAGLIREKYLAADFGPESRLPDMQNVSYVHSSVVWDDSLTEEETRRMRYGRVGSILPYLDQNGYTREKREQIRDTVVLRNSFIRAEFLPWMGGRMISLQAEGRELLSVNPVIQPCNLALRNAWCSGGVEWNVSIRGHNPLTCEILFTELLRLEDGTAGVRFYEYERIRGVVWRTEAYLPEDSRFLFIQVHVENPEGNGEVPMYWWSNMAVPEEPGTRIIAPAETAVLSLYDAGQYRMLRRKLPVYEDMDLSRPCEIRRSVDVFFDIPEGQRPFIAALREDHTGLVQCSTAGQYGRKLFVWGMGQGGRHWQDFLSDGKTRYVEIQAGIAKTQQEHLPMPDGAVWEWLEAYGSLRCNTDGLSFAEAAEQCGTALEAVLPYATLQEEFGKRGRKVAGAKGRLIIHGSGWGALENRRRAAAGMKPVSAVCTFPESTEGREQEPWRTLLETGRFGEDNLNDFPKAYLIAEPWTALLEKAQESAAVCYHRGIAAYAAGDTVQARRHFAHSLKLQDNAPAHRALARMDLQAGEKENCLRHYRRSLELSCDMTELLLEYAQTLCAFGEYELLIALLNDLDRETAALPRFLYLQAVALTETGRYGEAEEILLRPLVIPDMREGEISLSDVWFRLYMKKEKLSRTEAEKRHPLPETLDFRMH